MPMCTQLPCICAVVELKKHIPIDDRILHALKGTKGKPEQPDTTLCGKTNKQMQDAQEMYTSRPAKLLTPEKEKTACRSCRAWVRNGGPYYTE